MTAAAPVRPTLLRAVVAHYEAALAAHGPTARGMDWKDEASQALRFDLLCDVCELGGLGLREIGCGAGHLADHLRRRGIAADYQGVDLSPAMVAAARARHPEVAFTCTDVLRDESLAPVDVVLCSGLFHVRLSHEEGEWRAFLHAMLRRMFEMSRVALAFNLLSDRVDYRESQLFYESPGRILDFCRDELSRHVRLRHDYPLFEYTVYVYREPHQR